MKHQIYRCWDKYGVLLYVGRTSYRNGRHRLANHKRNSLWFYKVSSHKIEFETFPSKMHSKVAEALAIRLEHPKYNKHRQFRSLGEAIRQAWFNALWNCGCNERPQHDCQCWWGPRDLL